MEKCFSVTFITRNSGETDERYNTLHAKITKNSASKIADYYDIEHISQQPNSFTGILFSKSQYYPDSHYSPGLFVTVQVIETHPSDTDSGEQTCEVPLLVSPVFLKHYALKQREDIFFKPTSCVPLDRVIFGVRSRSTYQWASSVEWQKQLAVSAALEHPLCRSKDVLLLKVPKEDQDRIFQFIALECSPVNQGHISSNTTVIITKLDDESKKHSQERNELNAESYIQLIKYTSGILLPFTSHAFESPIAPIFKACVESNKALRVLPNDYTIVVAKRPPHHVGQSLDVHSVVFISDHVLKCKKLDKGDWIKICVTYQEKEITDMASPRYASVFPLSMCSSLGEDSVCFSPQLWFNVRSGISSLLETNVKLTLLEKASKHPPYANEVFLTLIQSPDYLPTVIFGDLLTKYFSTPRLLRKGDVLTLSSQENVTFHQYLENSRDYFRWPMIYLKVANIPEQEEKDTENCGYLVDNLHTKIYQVGTAQSYIPATIETFLSLHPTHPLLSDPVPAGMGVYIEKLHRLVFPLLKHRSDYMMVNCNILLIGPVGCGKTMLVKALCRCLNLHYYVVNCQDLFIDPTPDRIKETLTQAQIYAPCIMMLKDGDYVGKERETLEKDPKLVQTFCKTMKKLNAGTSFPVITIATTSRVRSINAEVNSVFLHRIEIEVPNESERVEILESLFNTTTLSNDVSLAYVAQRTAGLVMSDLYSLANIAIKSAYFRIKEKLRSRGLVLREQEDLCRAGLPVCQQDMVQALEEVNSAQAQAIGAPKIPNVQWEDVGGLSDVKQEIIDTIQLPLQYPELMLSGLRRSGVLLFGPPGTGKTMLAKAVATECSLNFISVKGPELINMYVGQSEENVRDIFSQARSAAPCIIFFDEIDSLAPNRGNSGDSGGVMDRLVSQLLAELDGLNKSAEVFVIGATNRPDLLDPALLRPGRFDRRLYVGIAEDRDSRMKILLALTRKFLLDDNVNLAQVEEACPSHLTGADFYSLCSSAFMNAIGRIIAQLEKGENPKQEARVSQEDFLGALKALVPSVSAEELKRFHSLRDIMND